MDPSGAVTMVHSPRSLISLFLMTFVAGAVASQQGASGPLPDIRQLIEQVREHQHQLDKVREDYTYTSIQTTQDVDSSGQVKKTETNEYEIFFVNSHSVGRMVKKDGRPLDEHEGKAVGVAPARPGDLRGDCRVCGLGAWRTRGRRVRSAIARGGTARPGE
jgi:hypothetical protein